MGLGDRLMVNSSWVLPRGQSRYPVENLQHISWEADRSIESRGWLICLHSSLRNESYVADCGQLGDDLYAGLDLDCQEKSETGCYQTVPVVVHCSETCLSSPAATA